MDGLAQLIGPTARSAIQRLETTPTGRLVRVNVRDFTLDDWDVVTSIWEAAEGMTAPSREEVERKLDRDPQLFVVAEDGTAVIGVAMGTFDGRRGFIFRLAVAPDHRGRGIGSALVSELERRFADMGVTKVRVLVFRTNETARSFWEAQGYEAAEDVMMFSKDW